MMEKISVTTHNIIISRLDVHDEDIVKQVVDIHVRTFTGFFLTFLGKGFLRCLYTGFTSHPKSGLYIAQDDKRVVGFLAYSEDLSCFYKYLIRSSLIPFAWYSIGAFFRKPSAMLRLIRAFFKSSESRREEAYIEISSIGVLPEMKNRHIGSRLIFELQSRFDGQRFAYIKLETDAVDNDSVNAFYRRNGFKLADSYDMPEGRKMNEYRYC